MSRFVVIREAGPSWTPDVDVLDQPQAADHAAFMSDLAAEGFVLLAGPVASSKGDRFRALLVVEAPDEAAIGERLAGDPWARTQKLRTSSVTAWTVFVGAERLVTGR